MKKYNSVFTVALSIDHDKKDASDITMNDCPHCGGEGFVYSTHYADPYATTRRCECTERDPDEKYEQQNDK